MPPTEAAIQLYSHWITKYMESHESPKFQENFAVKADASSSSAWRVVGQRAAELYQLLEAIDG